MYRSFNYLVKFIPKYFVVIDAIESGSDEKAFEATLDSGEEEFDPFEELMKAAGEAEEKETAKAVSLISPNIC